MKATFCKMKVSFYCIVTQLKQTKNWLQQEWGRTKYNILRNFKTIETASIFWYIRNKDQDCLFKIHSVLWNFSKKRVFLVLKKMSWWRETCSGAPFWHLERNKKQMFKIKRLVIRAYFSFHCSSVRIFGSSSRGIILTLGLWFVAFSK